MKNTVGYIDGKVRDVSVSVGNSIKCPQLEYRTGGWSGGAVYGKTQKIRGWTLRIDGTVYMTDPTGESKYLSIGGGIEGLHTALKLACLYRNFTEARKKEHWPF